MKHCLIVYLIALILCSCGYEKKEPSIKSDSNTTQSIDTIYAISDKIANRPLKTEINSKSPFLNTGFTKAVNEVENKYETGIKDSAVLYRNETDTFFFYTTKDSDFLQYLNISTKYEFLIDILQTGTSAAPLLKEVNIQKSPPNAYLIIRDEEEYSTISVEVRNNTIKRVIIDYIVE